MNNNINLNNLRQLLHKYYEAETSPEEEILIISLFSEIPAEDIPEDLAEDRLLFLTMNELLPTQPELEAPDDLYEKINRKISKMSGEQSTNTKGKWKKRLLYPAGITAACVAISIIFNPSETIKTEVESAEPTINHYVAKIGLHPNTDDGYFEVTDPEEAKEIILEIGNLLANNSTKAKEATQMVESTVEEFKEINKSKTR